MILLSLAVSVAGAFVVVATSQWVRPETFAGVPPLASMVGRLQALPGYETPYAALWGAAGLLAGGFLFYLEVRAPRRGRQILLSSDRLGRVTVSLRGLRRLANHVVQDLEGIEQISAVARVERDGLAFRCRVVVSPEASTSDIAAEIRERLAETVKRHTGKSLTGLDIQAHVASHGITRRGLE
jgi:hypothetical protein